MSYTPTTWAAGDTITSAKLNKLEQGLGNAITFVHVSEVEVPANDDSENEGLTKSSVEGSSLPGDLSDDLPTSFYKLDKTYTEIAEAFENGLVLCVFDNSYDTEEYKELGFICAILHDLESEETNLYTITLAFFNRPPLEFYATAADGELTTIEPNGNTYK